MAGPDRPSWWDLRPRVPAADLAIGALGLIVLMLIADAPLLGLMKRMPGWFEGFFQWATHFGESGYLLIGSAVIGLAALAFSRLAIRRTSRAMARFGAEACLFLFTAVAVSGIAVNIIKPVIGRARPKMMINEGWFGFDPPGTAYALQSFPSGHANTAIAASLALGLLAPRLRVPLAVIGCVIAYSRVAIGAHYFSDVIAGGLLAVFTTLWLARIFARHGLVFVPRYGAPHGVTHTPAGRLALRAAHLTPR